jgi:hypothetical protein
MGTLIRRKNEKLHIGGYSVGDKVSHSKIGASVGIILYFADFPDGVYAMVDYNNRKRLEKIDDLLPVRSDIYIG